jgi:hypothetical protein
VVTPPGEHTPSAAFPHLEPEEVVIDMGTSPSPLRRLSRRLLWPPRLRRTLVLQEAERLQDLERAAAVRRMIDQADLR